MIILFKKKLALKKFIFPLENKDNIAVDRLK
jgi:hypothetical protein